MDYEILIAKSTSEMEAEVRRRIAQGWRPAGGVSVTLEKSEDGGYTRIEITVYQAMVREQ